MTDTLVIYHNDADGMGAALCAYLILQDSAEYMPMQYGWDPPKKEEVEGRNVLMFDFSLKREEMQKINKEADSFLCFDHHKTAQKELEGLDYCVFDVDKSGCMLAFDHFLNDLRIKLSPEGFLALRMLCRYVQDRDLWQWKLPDSKLVNTWISSFPLSLEYWNTFVEYFWGGEVSLDVVSEAKAILRQQSVDINSLTQSPLKEQWLNYKVAIVNSPLLQSDIGHKLLEEHEDVDIAVIWFGVAKEGLTEYVYSLRSRKDGPDVSDLAKSMGGGGHRNAAGFRMKEHPNMAITAITHANAIYQTENKDEK